MAAKMFDLEENTRDTQQVKSYDYNLQQYYRFVYSQGSAKKLFVFIFLVLDRHLVFLGFWFAGLNMKFSCLNNPDFTVPRVSNEGVK